MHAAGSPDGEWWRDAVIYQVYPRSFADASGDGIGDLPGVTSRLEHLAELGVDAVWLSPFYRSPQADAGYDVADYRDVDPLFGTLADFDELLARAHGLGLRVIVDLVPNHTSDEHVWFQAALAAGPGSPERARYLFRDGKGPDGSLPPNNWESIFGGAAWTRVADGQWFLHLFDSRQPDLDWEHPEVRAEFEDDPAVLARPRGRRLPRRRRARHGQGAGPARLGRARLDDRGLRRRRRRRGRPPATTARCSTRTASTTSTARGTGSWPSTPATARSSPRPGWTRCPG